MMQNRVLYPGEILLPSDADGMTAWACVACDQFTSQPEYWEEARSFAAGKPSALNLILPECDLDKMEERVPLIHAEMQKYLSAGVLAPGVQNGFILTERTTENGARIGLVALLDLECYEYRKGSQSLVRATEETILSRLPARMNIRRGAALELSHVLMLIDDPMHTVLEPLHARRDTLQKLYDFPLMMNGGHLRGYAVTAPADVNALYESIDQLCRAIPGDHPLLFAVGDGNHSLASAKACWEEIKPTLSYEQTASHPARFALVEVENIHDDALLFEPIHRVLFGYDGDHLLDDWAAYAAARGMSLAGEENGQEIICVYEGKQVNLSVEGSPNALAVGTLQSFLDDWLAEHPAVRIDYVHGADTARRLAQQKDVIAFLLPSPDGSALFATVEKDGALPRKTFSMGHAHEKRYYLECRKLLEK